VDILGFVVAAAKEVCTTLCFTSSGKCQESRVFTSKQQQLKLQQEEDKKRHSKYIIFGAFSSFQLSTFFLQLCRQAAASQLRSSQHRSNSCSFQQFHLLWRTGLQQHDDYQQV
jgi:hypothetical protein